MQDRSNYFYGIDHNSQAFADIIDAACHHVGGRERLYALVRGVTSDSKTMTSDSITLVMALGYSAIDLHKPDFALQMVSNFMSSFADKLNELTADEIADIEILFLTSLRESRPDIAATIGITDTTLAQYKNYKQSNSDASNGTQNGTQNL